MGHRRRRWLGGSDNKCKINFEGRKQAILDLSIAETLLEPVDPIEIVAGSPLLDPQRWIDLEPAPDQRSKKKDSTAPAPQCEHCQKPLSRGVYSSDRRRKSCPRCSARDGAQHVFYPCPDGFGRSEERVTNSNPDGDQSYCYSCRGQDRTRALGAARSALLDAIALRSRLLDRRRARAPR